MRSEPPLAGPPPGTLRVADLLGALSLAAELSMGMPAEHALRSCYLGMAIADQLGLPPEERVGTYYAELLMDAGCTAWTSQLAEAIMSDEIAARRQYLYFTDADNPLSQLRWLTQHVATGQPALARASRLLSTALKGKEGVREGLRTSCEVAGHFAQRLGMPEIVAHALVAMSVLWAPGRRDSDADHVPRIAHILYVSTFLEAYHHLGGRAAALQLAQEREGKTFDRSVTRAFFALAADAGFWEQLEQESAWSLALSLEPPSPYRYVSEDKLDDIALSFADFADLKTPHSLGHSRRVGELAQQIARCMRLLPAEVTTIRRAGLMHDVGLVTAPSFTLQKPRAKQTPLEWEQMRLHPYYGERILAQAPALAPITPLVAAHHERLDGQGYYRGLAGDAIPRGARIIAVADCYDDLTHDTPDHEALGGDEALRRMREEVNRGLCPDAFDALQQALLGEGAGAPRSRATAHDWPAGLTDREVEILRLLASGLRQREVAERLVLSEHTVRHHLEHIYDKLAVNTRIGATLFAVEHDLLC